MNRKMLLILFITMLSVIPVAFLIVKSRPTPDSGRSIAGVRSSGNLNSWGSVAPAFPLPGGPPFSSVPPVSPTSVSSAAASSAALPVSKPAGSKAAANSSAPASSLPPSQPQGFYGALFEGSGQVITVTAAGMSTRYATVNVYEKSGQAWSKVLSGVSAIIGKNGMVADSVRVQDTDTTPAGVYNIRFAFGWADNPGTKLEYRVADDNAYWDENSGTANYNRWVEGNPGGDYEQLKTQPLYKYAMVLDFNWNQTPRKGAGIFIHIKPQHYTGGCIGIDEGSLLKIMAWVDSLKNPKVLICPQSDFAKYYY